jgi:segregation and condensation protein B
LEAVLFLTREALSTRKLAELADLADGTEARALVRDLGRRLRRRGSAFLPVEVAQGVLLMTRPQLADWIAKLHAPEEDLRLSAPALETLAVVAYRQPATRAEIEAIRGVQCGEILRVLMERDLLRMVGRSEELGRPFLYGTTRKFLQVFGLGRLEHLPPVDQIRIAAPAPARAA